MKKLAIVGVLTFAISGCVSQQQIAQRQAEMSALQSRLSAARANSTVTCANKQICEKAFALTKVYVQQNADMKIQHSDDTIISTFNPTQYAYIALQATKMPGSGDTATIQLTASCKGMESSFFPECASRITPIYDGFKPFVESKLK